MSGQSRSRSWPAITGITIILVVITTVPVVVFLLEKLTEQGSRNQTCSGEGICMNVSTECRNVGETIGITLTRQENLSTSVCGRYLPWLSDERYPTGNSSTLVVQVDNGCGLETKESELKLLFGLAGGPGTKKCESQGLPLICRYFYRPCLDGIIQEKYWPTRNECLTVKQDYCESAWLLLEQFQTSFCLKLPNCEQLPVSYPGQLERKKNLSYTSVTNRPHRTNDSVVPSGKPTVNQLTSQATYSSFVHTAPGSRRSSPTQFSQVSTNSSCKPPLVRSSSEYSICSPPCPAGEFVVGKDNYNLISSCILVCGLIWTLALFAIFYTWARLRVLWKFPHVVTLLVAIFYFIPGLFILIDIAVGPRTLHCSHDDFLGSWLNPSKFCKVQGAIFHFSFLASITLWCCSIFNVMEAVKSLTVEGNILKHSPRAVLSVEIALSVIIPSTVVATVHFTSSYTINPMMIICFPKDLDAIFYSYTIPTQIIAVTGLTMVVVIIKRMKQSCEFRAQKGAINEKSTLAGVAFTRHFLVLFCILPLLLLTGFTMHEIYAKFWAGDFVTITTKYIICIQTTDGSECVWLGNNTAFILDILNFPICTALVAVLLLVYSLSPRVARELWLSHIRKLRRLLCCKRRVDMN